MTFLDNHDTAGPLNDRSWLCCVGGLSVGNSLRSGGAGLVTTGR